ncbi:FKBP-type peptidyl-prolyl cis-trans isomerase [Ichthyenterobacterium magnum]|uniref:peptidylprolyl isomerase n=1 Tax=Ichthyenterobacterium magnum TaxID=1230530 RepID=A0A420DGF5_9FLAO|nr:peptidylprolyl isomerase [Ichthyenterobacterium magnum]RKE92157.1 hypothetical protein BXY80_2071 [Ichthyenterobacterium magnum]
MKIKNFSLLLLVFILSFTSCKKDDDGSNVSLVPERDRAEQQIEDKANLLEYLETHYYNASTFSTPGNYTISDIIITELPEDGVLPDPSNNTLLIDAVEIKTSTFADVQYEYYILKLNQGGGDTPNFTDDVKVNYEGSLLDEDVFDFTINSTVFDLLSLVEGWNKVMPEFNTATSFIINEDGTEQYDDYGLGVMFLPSGLGYFSSPPFGSSIPAYSNLIFKFELYQTEANDHDNDGVFSHLEDLNMNSDLLDDNTDGDNLSNFIDADDDGDGTLTINEDLEPDSDLLVDRNNDGDPTNDIGDGDPTNDDTDGDGIPNYLDTDNTESRLDE